MKNSKPKKHYDAIVIGSGGGSKLTRPIASLGKKVAIIEKGKLGGTCLNHGCIPSKMLIHSADVMTQIRNAGRFEIDVNQEDIKVRFKELVDRVTKEIDAESDSIQPLYDDNPNIDFYPTTARFIDNKTIEVDDDYLTADNIFIAAGARPNIPEIPGLSETNYMTYFEALRRQDQPKSLIVLGAGYIATELGYFFGALGTEVTFIVRSELLRPEDKEIKAEFKREFEKQFKVIYGEVEQFSTKDGLKRCQVKTHSGEIEEVEATDVLVATGVMPNTDILEIENTDIKCNEDGYIQVNDQLETTVPNVWAFGDIIGRNFFRHSANFEGEYLFNNLYKNKESIPIHYPPVPHAVFTHPQVASVGKTEETLKKEGIAYLKGVNKYKQSAMGMALRSESGLVKVLFDKSTEKLIGAHIVGDEASNMIHMLIAFMVMGATISDIKRMIYIHPALPEIVRNAVRNIPSK